MDILKRISKLIFLKTLILKLFIFINTMPSKKTRDKNDLHYIFNTNSFINEDNN